MSTVRIGNIVCTVITTRTQRLVYELTIASACVYLYSVLSTDCLREQLKMVLLYQSFEITPQNDEI